MAEEIKTAAPAEPVKPAADIEVATVTNLSATTVLPANAHPNDVVFVVKYPKDYKGEKTLPEGNVVVSKEVAEQFTTLGIGKTQA